jgi:hypothetical protein
MRTLQHALDLKLFQQQGTRLPRHPFFMFCVAVECVPDGERVLRCALQGATVLPIRGPELHEPLCAGFQHTVSGSRVEG